MIFYDRPRNVKGTAFLTFDYPGADRDDDQWLYLPALRKVRRISASDRGDFFLGTDFSYDDIKNETKVAIEDSHWKTLGKEQVDGHEVYVVERTPVSDEVAEETGYGRTVSYVDAKIWIIRRSEIWDPRGKRLKTIETKEVRKVDGIWTAHRIEAVNHKTRHRTVFTFRDVDYRGGADDNLYSKRALRRGR